MEFGKGNSGMTFDEISMERSKSFVRALQELKNLRPQLYSAADYCEKSYLHSQQKQMVADNLKDYAVRALVNAVDHLGTVAYKLTDILEQQASDISSTELKVSRLNQKILTCHTYMDKEGLRQQRLLASIPRHHKHYILPSSLDKRVRFSAHGNTDPGQSYTEAIPHVRRSGSIGSKTLSWHLASETKSTETQQAVPSTEQPQFPGKTTGVFHLADGEEITRTKPLADLKLPNVAPISSRAAETLGSMHREPLRVSKTLPAFSSVVNQNRLDTVHAPLHSKSILSAFFVKPKTTRLKAGLVS